jgi:hypothetical protein
MDTDRDPISHCPGTLNADSTLCTISAPITASVTLIPEVQYLFQGIIFVGDDVSETVLTIEPGTVLYGDATSATPSSIVIQRNSKIMAVGTAAAPITFTSSNAPGNRAPGDWGGLVLNGNAPVNACGSQPCSLPGEGETGTYGGSNPADSSGTIAYVKIQFSGHQITPEVEMNGLAFQGVGSGTVVHHVQIHRASDDSMEFFGGTAQVKHMLLSGTEDDGFDWTSGWQGKAQFVIVQQFDSQPADQGIEADNFEDNHDYEPRSNPTLYNFTMLGSANNAEDTAGIKLRRGTGATLRNFIIQGYRKNCFNLDDAATWAQQAAGAVSIDNSIMHTACAFADDDADEAGTLTGNLESAVWAAGAANSIADPMISAAFNETAPVYTPAAGSPALSGAAAPPAGDAFFESVTFIGAVGTDDWTAGWTEFPVN